MHRMTRAAGLAASVMLVALAVAGLGRPAGRVAHARPSDGYKTSEVIVKLNAASGATIAQINASYGTSTLGPVGSLAGVFRLGVPAGQDAEAVATAMAGDARLSYAHPNFLRQPPEANPRSSRAWGGLDPTPYATSYARGMLGLPAAQAISQGAGAVVAVIDTGVYLDHPALAGRLTATRYDFVDDDAAPDDVGNGADDDGDGEVDEVVGHGTHVAGIALMVAPQAKIMPLRVLDSDGIGDDALIARAIEYAVANGAHVINLSLGTADQSDVLDEAVEHATRAGVTVVSAAGNGNTTLRQYPAAENCAIAVSSVGPGDLKSSFSNYGSWIDLTAPGEAVYSMLEANGYGSWSGTSMAAPFVSGQAALVHALRPTWNPWQVSALIAATTVDIGALNPGYGSKLGDGRIDVAASVAALQAGAPAPVDGALISSSCVEAEVEPTPTPSPSPSPVPSPSPSPVYPVRALLPVVVR